MKIYHKFVDLSHLPRRKEGIDWGKSIGYDVYVEYNDKKGVLKILSYDKTTQKLTIKYNNFEYKINTQHLKDCKLGTLFSNNSKNVITGLNDVSTTHPHLIEYFVNKDDAKKVTHGGQSKVLLKCPQCGHIKEYKMNNFTTDGFKCEFCSDGISYGEKFIMSLLNQLKINYIYQLNKKHFEWCDKYKYDFYLIDYNTIIEVNGQQHYEKSFETCGGDTLQEVIINDVNKRNIAINHVTNYVVLDVRKSDFDFIKKSIMDNMKDLIDINKISFEKCQRDSLKSKIIEVGNLWNKYHNVAKIIELTKLHRTTICRYLKKCNDIGLCDYNKSKNNC